MKKIVAPLLAACALTANTVRAEVTNAAPPHNFAYVLQAEGLAASRAAVVQKLAECGRDWIVLDPSFTGGDDGEWTAAELKTIRAGKSNRKILAYLSIGEAEDYRGYWKKEWDSKHTGKPDAKAPAWLCAEDPDWKGNYKVRYWQPEWQAIILPRLDAILKAGFDGVYLDIVDGFEFFEFDPQQKDWIDDRPNPETKNTYRQDMITWIHRIATHTRQQRPGFLVVPQNGVQLLADAAYRAEISAIGVEDLFTNGNRLKKRKEITYSLDFLARLKPERKPVLLIEYGTKPAAAQASIAGAKENGFLLLVTDRNLKTFGRCESSE